MSFFTKYLKTEQNLNRTWPNSIYNGIHKREGQNIAPHMLKLCMQQHLSIGNSHLPGGFNFVLIAN